MAGKSNGAMQEQGSWRSVVGFDVDQDALLSTDEIISSWCAPGLEFTTLYDASPCPMCGRAPALQADRSTGGYLVFCADPRHASGVSEEQCSLPEAVARWNDWVRQVRMDGHSVVPFPRSRKPEPPQVT